MNVADNGNIMPPAKAAYAKNPNPFVPVDGLPGDFGASYKDNTGTYPQYSHTQLQGFNLSQLKAEHERALALYAVYANNHTNEQGVLTSSGFNGDPQYYQASFAKLLVAAGDTSHSNGPKARGS